MVIGILKKSEHNAKEQQSVTLSHCNKTAQMYSLVELQLQKKMVKVFH